MTKVYGIQTDDFDDLVKKLNEFNDTNKVYATQVFQQEKVDRDDSAFTLWSVLIYYEDQNHKQRKNIPNHPTSFQNSSPAIFKPATDSQKKLLKKLEYEGDMSKLSKSDAFKLLNKMLPKKK